MKEQHVSLVGRKQMVKIDIPQVGDVVFPNMDPSAKQADTFRKEKDIRPNTVGL